MAQNPVKIKSGHQCLHPMRSNKFLRQLFLVIDQKRSLGIIGNNDPMDNLECGFTALEFYTALFEVCKMNKLHFIPQSWGQNSWIDVSVFKGDDCVLQILLENRQLSQISRLALMNQAMFELTNTITKNTVYISFSENSLSRQVISAQCVRWLKKNKVNKRTILLAIAPAALKSAAREFRIELLCEKGKVCK
jgi:hypothetical protein